MFLPFLFFGRLSEETHLLDHSLGAEMLREIKVSPFKALKGKSRIQIAGDVTMRQGRARRFRLTSHHSPRYLKLLKVPNFHRPKAIFHEHTLYP